MKPAPPVIKIFAMGLLLPLREGSLFFP